MILEVVSKSEFDSLKDTMQMYQNNINNNITWFYSSLAIIIAVLIVGLIFLIKNSVSIGIEKGIEKTNKKIENIVADMREFNFVTGNIAVIPGQGDLLQIYGLRGLNKDNFVSLSIMNKHGRVCEYHSLDIKEGGLDVRVVDFNHNRDGSLLYFNVVWLNIDRTNETSPK